MANFLLRALCDINKSGTLNAEQFALAMHLISRRVRISFEEFLLRRAVFTLHYLLL